MNPATFRSATRRCNARILACVFLLLGVTAVSAQTKNSCLDCHQYLSEPLGVTAETFAQDIHARKGLTCAACHGGDPTSDDPSVAMSKAAKWRGKITRHQIPELCGSCHSNAALMKTYNPTLRVDQLQQYKTSVHGKRWAKGDEKVAVCTDCHGVHNLRSPKDSRSSVYPTNVAETCAHCHADAAHMKSYGIPTDQFASYKKSVHYKALTVGGDLSAPTCPTCHGNHGAAPPGVDSVVSVCSTCHAFQAELFEKSPHQAAFAQAGFPGCVTCHSNHEIQHPTDAMIGTTDGAVCVMCHSKGDAGYKVAGEMKGMLEDLQSKLNASNAILDKAEQAGMEVGEAKLEAGQAHDSLVKARVSIHAFNTAAVEKDVGPGLKLAKKTYEAGQAALRERDVRRKGLAVALIAIIVVLIGLRKYIRKIEKE